jgi:hypothetical protein
MNVPKMVNLFCLLLTAFTIFDCRSMGVFKPEYITDYINKSYLSIQCWRSSTYFHSQDI